MCCSLNLYCLQAELYRLVWADALLAHQGCWRLALEYFAWCPVHGAAAAQLAVTSLNVDWRWDAWMWQRSLLCSMTISHMYVLRASEMALMMMMLACCKWIPA